MPDHYTTRIQWSGTIPAGADADVNYPLGAIPEGMRLVICSCSYYGGDGGERYSVNIVPAGLPFNVSPMDATNGSVQWLYPLGGGTQTSVDPLNLLMTGVTTHPVPGPCSLALSATAPSAAALEVTVLGYLEPA